MNRATIVTLNVVRYDAVGNYVVSQARALKELGFDVRILAERKADLPSDLLPALTLARDAGALRKRHPDARRHLEESAVALFQYPTRYDLLELITEEIGAIKILDYHGVTPPELWRGPGRRRLVAGVRGLALARRADRAIAHSSFLRDELVREARLRPEQVHVLPVPVALGRFREAGLRTSRAVGPERPITLLYVGRMAPHKRLDILVEALGLVRSEGVDARLLLAGNADSWPFRLSLRRALRQASALGLAGFVRHVGLVPDGELPGLYASCDLLITASEHEGFCVPAAEAMAAGRPVVATASAGLPGTVGDGGLLVPPGEPRGLAEAVVRLARDNELYAATVERGLRRAEAFSEEAYRTALADLLRGCGIALEPSRSETGRSRAPS